MSTSQIVNGTGPRATVDSRRLAQLNIKTKYLLATATAGDSGTGCVHMKVDDDLEVLHALLPLATTATRAEIAQRLLLLRGSYLEHTAGVGSPIVDGEHYASDTVTQGVLEALPNPIDLAAGLADPGAAATEPGEETATCFARALVQLADACVIGVPCEKHHGAVHGREAEELRKGIEKVLAQTVVDGTCPDVLDELQRLLDDVDARDSLAFLEATTCVIAGCLHHAHPDCPCGHPPGTVGACGGCNCCDEAP